MPGMALECVLLDESTIVADLEDTSWMRRVDEPGRNLDRKGRRQVVHQKDLSPFGESGSRSKLTADFDVSTVTSSPLRAVPVFDDLTAIRVDHDHIACLFP